MRVFFDTNVLVYAFRSSDANKQRVAHSLIRRSLVDDESVISTQVVVEFANAVLKHGEAVFTAAEAGGAIRRFSAFEIVETTTAAILDALELMQREQLSWWDALIVESAVRSGCEVLYSEDLQHGRRYETLRVENPFPPPPSVREPRPGKRAGARRR